MTIQILRKKFTVGQYHQMFERDPPPGRGRVSRPGATDPVSQSTSLINGDNSTLDKPLGVETTPLPGDGHFVLGKPLGAGTTPLPGDGHFVLGDRLHSHPGRGRVSRLGATAPTSQSISLLDGEHSTLSVETTPLPGDGHFVLGKLLGAGIAPLRG